MSPAFKLKVRCKEASPCGKHRQDLSYCGHVFQLHFHGYHTPDVLLQIYNKKLEADIEKDMLINKQNLADIFTLLRLYQTVDGMFCDLFGLMRLNNRNFIQILNLINNIVTDIKHMG